MTIFLEHTGANGFAGTEAALQAWGAAGGIPNPGQPNRPEENYVFARARQFLDDIASGAAVPHHDAINGLIRLYENVRAVQAGAAVPGVPGGAVAGLNPATDLLQAAATNEAKVRKLFEIVRAPALEPRGVGIGSVLSCLGNGGSAFGTGVLAGDVVREMKRARAAGHVWTAPSPELQRKLDRQYYPDPTLANPAAVSYYGVTPATLTAAAQAMDAHLANPGDGFIERDPRRSIGKALEASVGAFYDAHYAGVGGAPANFVGYPAVDRRACKDAAIEFLDALRSNPTMKMAPSVDPAAGGGLTESPAAAVQPGTKYHEYGISRKDHGRMVADLGWSDAEAIAASRLRAATRALFDQHGGLTRAYITEMSRSAGRAITEGELCHLGALAGIDLARGGAAAGIVDAHAAAVPVNTADVAGAPNPATFAAALGEGLSSDTRTANRTNAAAQGFDGGGINVGALTAIVADMDGVRRGVNLGDLPSYGVDTAARGEFPTFDAALVAGAAGRVGGAAVTDLTIMNTQLSLVADALEECRRVKGARIAHGAPTCASDSRVAATVTALCQPGNEIAKNIFVDWVNANSGHNPPLDVADLDVAQLGGVSGGAVGQTKFQRIVARASGRDDSVAAAGAAAGAGVVVNAVPLIMREDPYLTMMQEFDREADLFARLTAAGGGELAQLRRNTASGQARLLFSEIRDFLQTECQIETLPLESASAVCEYIASGGQAGGTSMPAGLGRATERAVEGAATKWAQICAGNRALGAYGHISTADPVDLKILQLGMDKFKASFDNLYLDGSLEADKQYRNLQRDFKTAVTDARVELQDALEEQMYEAAKRRVSERRWRERGVHTQSEARAYHAKETGSNVATAVAALTVVAVLILIGLAIAGAPLAAGFVAAGTAGEAVAFIASVAGMGAVASGVLGIAGAAWGGLVDGSKAIKKGEYGDASADREIEATRKVKEIRNRLKEAETFASEEHLDVDELAMAARQFHGSLEKAAHHVNLDRSKIADLDDVKIAVDQLRAAAKESSKTLAEVNTGGGAGSGAAKVKGARDSARDELVAAIIEERSR